LQKLKRQRKRKKRTWRPSNWRGIFWPGTRQSGPAASTMASSPNPLPIGSGCWEITAIPKNMNKGLLKRNDEKWKNKEREWERPSWRRRRNPWRVFGKREEVERGEFWGGVSRLKKTLAMARPFGTKRHFLLSSTFPRHYTFFFTISSSSASLIRSSHSHLMW